MQLDSRLYFTDLWNWVGYRYAFTLWTPHSRAPFTRPRRSMFDDDRGAVPIATRFPSRWTPSDVDLVRKSLPNMPVVPDGGDWAGDPRSAAWVQYHRTLANSFPEAMKNRLLLLVPSYAVYDLNQLTAQEQQQCTRICRATVRATESEGIAALEIGDGFEVEDYADLLHFSPRGGDKMAVLVAAKVRERARALGFIPER